ncbi:hypothetical protein EON81_17835 [bacterium]|nr:MAG: hypothetical protein EON81_17835 [bacterium]
MSTTNETVTASAGFLTILIGGYTAWAGYKNKGKDQEHARETASYDNLQEDLRNCRHDLAAERERADRYQSLWDACEERRMEELARYRESMAADQALRHDLRSLVRNALARMEDAGVDCEDLRERARFGVRDSRFVSGPDL